MPRLTDMAGLVFGRLIVLRYVGNRLWLCRCTCGQSKAINGSSLRAGDTSSCGCAYARHGHSRDGGRTPEYVAWNNMLARCERVDHPSFRHYGGRGIKVCDRWHVFENFLADMGLRPDPKLTLDRIDNNGDYTPGNCAWRSRLEQLSNTRRTKRTTIVDGVERTVAEWAAIWKISKPSAYYRIGVLEKKE